MSKSLFFALIMLFATFLSAYAEDSSKKVSLGAGATYGFVSYGSAWRATHAPGISLTLDYALDTRSSLFLNYTRQSVDYGSDGKNTKHLASLGYKYWLSNGGKWRPWVQASAGYLWDHSEWTYQSNGTTYKDEYTSGDFQLSAGGGVRYELLEDLGLTASAQLYKAGAPWHWSYTTKLLTTSVGLEYRF